jgi:hypothetical protein
MLFGPLVLLRRFGKGGCGGKFDSPWNAAPVAWELGGSEWVTVGRDFEGDSDKATGG